MTEYKYDRGGLVLTIIIFLCGLLSLWAVFTLPIPPDMSPFGGAFLFLWGLAASFYAAPFMFFVFVRQKVQTSDEIVEET